MEANPERARFSLAGACIAVVLFLAASLARPTEGRGAEPSSAEQAKPYNIILVLSDQEQYQLLRAQGYELPARRRLAERGVTFRSHYVAAAMCSPSRAALLTGQPPQRNGVFDQMEYPYVPNLRTDLPNMGSVLKNLGYATAYFGKFEMNRDILRTKDTVNYSTALQPYGFDTFGAAGDVGSRPDSGYENDALTAGEAVQWLRMQNVAAEKDGKPFFMVASFLNPHDIMYANANLPGEDVQKGAAHHELTSPPDNTLYEKEWQFTLPPSLTEPLSGPGMPPALAEYQNGWSGGLGFIPANRPDMWRRFYNYYLNMIRDNDTKLQELVDALDEMGLWKNTIVIVTADHGEMGGSHGALRGKGPFAYEENAHVPFVIVHPDHPRATSDLLTSHLDLLPTMVGFTKLPEAKRKEAVAGLPGHDFSAALAKRGDGDVHAVRSGVLFNFVAPLTIDAGFCEKALSSGSGAAAKAAMNLVNLEPHLGKRGFLTFVYDGRYKLARYYAPDAFNTPTTLDEIFQHNDVQLFDLKNDPDETRNLALDRAANRDTILRMNALLNELMAKEVGTNDGSFLPEVIRPTGALQLGS